VCEVLGLGLGKSGNGWIWLAKWAIFRDISDCGIGLGVLLIRNIVLILLS